MTWGSGQPTVTTHYAQGHCPQIRLRHPTYPLLYGALQAFCMQCSLLEVSLEHSHFWFVVLGDLLYTGIQTAADKSNTTAQMHNKAWNNYCYRKQNNYCLVHIPQGKCLTWVWTCYICTQVLVAMSTKQIGAQSKLNLEWRPTNAHAHGRLSCIITSITQNNSPWTHTPKYSIDGSSASGNVLNSPRHFFNGALFQPAILYSCFFELGTCLFLFFLALGWYL